VDLVVVAAMTMVSRDECVAVSRATKVSNVADSLRFVIALNDIQEALKLFFDPRQLQRLYSCLSIDDMIIAIENMMSSEKTREYDNIKEVASDDAPIESLLQLVENMSDEAAAKMLRQLRN
jgi:hypothetical protein